MNFGQSASRYFPTLGVVFIASFLYVSIFPAQASATPANNLVHMLQNAREVSPASRVQRVQLVNSEEGAQYEVTLGKGRVLYFSAVNGQPANGGLASTDESEPETEDAFDDPDRSYHLPE